MSMKNGVWHNAKIEQPKDGELCLCVKQNKKGNRSMCLGSHWSDREWDNGWVTGGGCNNVTWWMPLPPIPEE